MKKIINTSNAPKAVGPYSQAVEANGTLYISGQLPVDPLTGAMPEGIEAQTRQCLQNVIAILEAANYTLSDVVKSVVLLTDMADFQAMNQIYATYYAENQPARVCYQVAKLPLGALVEIETIAVQ
jgi:2-iminobutanoate/2-iminopropanoate deaminase